MLKLFLQFPLNFEMDEEMMFGCEGINYLNEKEGKEGGCSEFFNKIMKKRRFWKV